MAPTTRALAGFFAEVFDASELKELVRDCPDGEALLRSVSLDGVSRNDASWRAADALARRKLVDAELMGLMIQRRPRHEGEIHALFGVGPAASGPRGGAPPSPVVRTSSASSGAPVWGDLGLAVEAAGPALFVRGERPPPAGFLARLLAAINSDKPPMDWSPSAPAELASQPDLLQVLDGEGRWIVLPQVVLIDPGGAPPEEEVRLVDGGAFRPAMMAPDALEFYRRDTGGGVKRRFFDGVNARLCNWSTEEKILLWQKCQYFDYLTTNLALDAPIPPGGATLRAAQRGPGVIRPLSESTLANSTGINGLVFTTDGYMIYQRRRPDVLIRPGGLCSGFSGTVDWDDIVHAVEKGGTLARFDALREMFEELDVRRDEVERRWWLGATREIVRGGAPELFYCAYLKIPADALLGRMPRDREGAVLKLRLDGSPEAGGGRSEPVATLWAALHRLAREGGGPITIPLLTNLVLWWRAAGRPGTRVARLGEGPR